MRYHASIGGLKFFGIFKCGGKRKRNFFSAFKFNLLDSSLDKRLLLGEKLNGMMDVVEKRKRNIQARIERSFY